MKKISIKSLKNVDSFMSDRVKVPSLEKGAELYNGATEIFNHVYSNISKTNYIEIKDNGALNELALYIPSTLFGDILINNTEYVNKYKAKIASKHYENILCIDAKGVYRDNDSKKNIYEDVTIISTLQENISVEDIQCFIDIASQVKQDMQQYCVSVTVNNSLILV